MKKEALDDDAGGAFKATCSTFFLKTTVSVKPRTISFRAYDSVPIDPPAWCPLRPENLHKPKIHDISGKFSNNESSVTSKPAVTVTPTTVAEKPAEPEKVEIPRRTEWDKIVVGGKYVMPRIGQKPCKVVCVTEKTERSFKFKEVERDNTLSYMTSMAFHDDVEAKVIVKYKSF